VSHAGTQAIQFAGGEPLLRNDISDIVSHAVHNDIYVALNTNGLLMENNSGKT
jgi:molybdenum cofactor biosynthesis enzyme MoaA